MAKKNNQRGGGVEPAGEALHEGEGGPEENAEGVDFFGAEAIEQPAAGDLGGGVGPAKSREDAAELQGVDAELLFGGGSGHGKGGAAGIVQGGDDEDHRQDEVADAGGFGVGESRGHGLHIVWHVVMARGFGERGVFT